MKPKRIVLIRHGQSEGNLDENVYADKPDWRLELTPAGRAQARAAGDKLKSVLDGGAVQAYVSPYVRTIQTFEEINKSLTMRLFCMRWFHWTIEQYEELANPRNCEYRVMGLNEEGRYVLDTPFRKYEKAGDPAG